MTIRRVRPSGAPREFLVPATIADQRVVTVLAVDAAEARAKVSAGQYKTLGRSLNRGFLLVGTPVEKVTPA
jgi:hypothetical protein